MVVVAEYHPADAGSHSSFVNYVPFIEKEATVFNQVTGKDEKMDIILNAPASPEINWASVLQFLLIPIAFIWGVIPTISFLYRWIKAGFAEKTP